MVQDRKIDVDKREQLIINSDVGSYLKLGWQIVILVAQSQQGRNHVKNLVAMVGRICLLGGDRVKAFENLDTTLLIEILWSNLTLEQNSSWI